MDVPFISSGAMSRAQYSLVRKVESASSAQLGDQYLLSEIESIRRRFEDPGLSLKQSKEYLIILMYCAMTITSGIVLNGQFDFALPHAVSLAEAGHTVQDKRIGYFFCAELMPADHELQLMLVNTLRKDLESELLPRICLALDNLISSSNEDVIPAVQSRLHDLLSHNSPHVRRRTLLAFRALSQHDSELLRRITNKVQRRLNDADHAVVSAAMIVSTDLVNMTDAQAEINDIINKILTSTWSGRTQKSRRWFLRMILRTLQTAKLSQGNIHVVLEIIRYAASSQSHALLYGSFLLLSDDSSGKLAAQRGSLRPVHNIRHLLTSTDPNEQFIFLSCLECLEPHLWAGTSPETPVVLEGWEVERVMQLLKSPDSLIRKKTLRILHRVDTNIVESYYSQSLKAISPGLSLKNRNDYVTGLLEVIEIVSGEDGEDYAKQLKNLFKVVEDDKLQVNRSVLEGAVEMVLKDTRHASSLFRVTCAASIITSIVELEIPFGPTFMVIASAFASEYCGQVSIPPVDILRGLATRLAHLAPTVQDACLLSMLRVAASCDAVPADVLGIVATVRETAGRHIRRRCDQFTALCKERDVLADIVLKAKSSSLPDFLEALSAHQSPASNAQSLTTSPSWSPNASSTRLSSMSGSKLRYAAYEPPQVAPRLRRGSSSQLSTSSSSSTYSDHGLALDQRQSLDELSKTVTAGDLALAAGDIALDGPKSPSIPMPRPAVNIQMEDLTSRVDLMTFDSPFISDPSEVPSSSSTYSNFESTWNALEKSNARGWCELSVDAAIHHLQGQELNLEITAADQPPFEGDLKILITSGTVDGRPVHAALRLRETEEQSSLWRLRCDNDELLMRMRRLLMDA